MTSSIRHLSTANGSPLFAAAAFEKTVHIFRTGSANAERVIFTNLDFGGNRLQIVPQRNMLIAGAYSVHGIEGYDLITGRRSWQRRDLKKVQSIQRNPREDTVSCFFDDRAGVVIDVMTGQNLSACRGVKNIYFSQDGTSEVEERQSKYRVRHLNSMEFDIKAESFGLLGVAFSRNLVALSEVGAAVRMYSLDHGHFVARYDPPSGYHVLAMNYNPAANFFAGVLWGYQSAGDYFLVHLSDVGEELFRFGLNDAYESVFLSGRESILLASGREIELRTGREIFRYVFPTHDDKSEPTRK